LYLAEGKKQETATNTIFQIWRLSPALVVSDDNEYSVSGTLNWELVKQLNFNTSGASFAELRVDTNLKASGSPAGISIRIDDVEKANHSTSSTTYVPYSDTINTAYLADGAHTLKLYLQTGNKQKPASNSLFEFFRTKTYASSGTIASQVFDTTISGTRWDGLVWDSTLPATTNVTFEVRASDTIFTASASTPSWTSVGNSPVLTGLPSGRYMQWRATLTSTVTNAYTPTLSEVRTYYYHG
jgi:hypothetical protein